MTEALPAPNEPLVLADGTTIDPSTGGPVQQASTFVEIPNAQRAQDIVGRTRRRVVDLPEPPKTMNAIGVVLMYTMYGLARQEIAIATGLTIEQITNIRTLEAYRTLESEIVDNVLVADAANVKALLAKASHRAAERIAGLVDSPSPDIQLNAAKDILNRTGHSAKDERDRIDLSEALNIVVTVRDETVTRPMIDITGDHNAAG